MNPKMLVTLAMATMSLFFAAGCSLSAKKKSIEAKSSEAPTVVGAISTAITFDSGKSQLTEFSREELKTLSALAKENNRAIREIRILAWSDKEYPVAEDQKKDDIKLAKKRAQEIKNFLQHDLNERNAIGTYNMAQRPSVVSKVFKSDEYKVKEAFEMSGATSSTLPDGSVSYTKASRALVIIDYKGDEDYLK